jgi:hypothetical protein
MDADPASSMIIMNEGLGKQHSASACSGLVGKACGMRLGLAGMPLVV